MPDFTTVPPRELLDESFLRDFAERWHAAWNSQDASKVAALCSDDVEIIDPSQPAPLRGVAGIRALMEPLARAFPDYLFASSEPPYASTSRRKAIVPWRFEGTMTGPLKPPGFAPTGRVVSFEGDDHWSFRGELVYSSRQVYDVNSVAVQIGAAPPPGSRGERAGVLLQRLVARRQRRGAG